LISAFLGWSEMRVRLSLERLGLIDAGRLDAEAVRWLPTENTARDFTKAAKELKPTVPQQRTVAKRIAEMTKGERGESAVRREFVEAILPKRARTYALMKDFTSLIAEAAALISKLGSKLDELAEFKKDFNSEIYVKTFERFSFEANKQRLLKKFKTLEKETENERRALQENRKCF
jgi:hypothetical protein